MFWSGLQQFCKTFHIHPCSDWKRKLCQSAETYLDKSRETTAFKVTHSRRVLANWNHCGTAFARVRTSCRQLTFLTREPRLDASLTQKSTISAKALNLSDSILLESMYYGGPQYNGQGRN